MATRTSQPSWCRSNGVRPRSEVELSTSQQERCAKTLFYKTRDTSDLSGSGTPCQPPLWQHRSRGHRGAGRPVRRISRLAVDTFCLLPWSSRVSNEACNVYIQLTAERRQYTTVRLHSALGSLTRSWITNWEQVSRPERSARRSARRESPRTGRRVRRAFRPHPARTAPERVRPGRRRPGHTPSDPSFPDGTAGR